MPSTARLQAKIKMMSTKNDAPPPPPPPPPALFAIVQEALPCSGDGSIFSQCLEYFDTPTILITLLGADMWDQVVSYMDAFTLGALEMTCRHALGGGWTPEGRWEDMDKETFRIERPRLTNLRAWLTAFYAFHRQGFTAASDGNTVMSFHNAIVLTVSPFVEAHRDDTTRMKVLRCARMHEWCRAETNLICLCPLFTGGPKCRWEKKMSRSEEKDQIFRLRTNLQREGIAHEPHVQQLLN